MTQENKELLLKDLCARLPYSVKCEVVKRSIDGEMLFIRNNSTALELTVDNVKELVTNDMYEIKPYLFPLSNMTEEQYKEWCDLEEEPLDEILTRNANGDKMSTLEHHLLIAKSLTDSVNYCYKNHFDINGLIEKGLAIDATRLNIY